MGDLLTIRFVNTVFFQFYQIYSENRIEDSHIEYGTYLAGISNYEAFFLLRSFFSAIEVVIQLEHINVIRFFVASKF